MPAVCNETGRKFEKLGQFLFSLNTVRKVRGRKEGKRPASNGREAEGDLVGDTLTVTTQNQ